MWNMTNEVNTARRDASGRGSIRTERSRRMRSTIAKCAASMLRSGLHRPESQAVKTRLNTAQGLVRESVDAEAITTNGKAELAKTRMDIFWFTSLITHQVGEGISGSTG